MSLATAASESVPMAGGGAAGTPCSASTGDCGAWVAPEARATSSARAMMSPPCTVSASVPGCAERMPIETTAPARLARARAAGPVTARRVTASGALTAVSRASAASTRKTESVWPTAVSTASRPAYPNACCTLMTQTVSPCPGVSDAAAATAAHPARSPAAGPATASANRHDGHSRRTGSSTAIPSCATSARDRAPTSTHRSSTRTIGSDVGRERHRCVLRTATTAGRAPLRVMIRIRWPSWNWSHRADRRARPLDWSRTYPSAVISLTT